MLDLQNAGTQSIDRINSAIIQHRSYDNDKTMRFLLRFFRFVSLLIHRIICRIRNKLRKLYLFKKRLALVTYQMNFLLICSFFAHFCFIDSRKELQSYKNYDRRILHTHTHKLQTEIKNNIKRTRLNIDHLTKANAGGSVISSYRYKYNITRETRHIERKLNCTFN